MLDIKLADLVTLKGLSKQEERPVGIVKKKMDSRTFEIFWINENLATRFALVSMVKSHRLEVISKADR
jgi:predicted CoA-binding protein